MFEKHDKALLNAKKVILILLSIIATASFVLSIVLSIMLKSGLYFLVFFPCLIACLLGWVFYSLILTFYCDIKLIRNKLYGESNKNLSEYFAITEETKSKESNVNNEDALKANNPENCDNGQENHNSNNDSSAESEESFKKREEAYIEEINRLKALLDADKNDM